ncbi:MAG: hypothetical protein ACXVR1_07695 [Solirubrobacteraceae bacterium]
MRIHRLAGRLAVALTLVATVIPVADALGAPNMAGSALKAAPVHDPRLASAPARPAATAAVPERVWQEINDALAIKLMNRS